MPHNVLRRPCENKPASLVPAVRPKINDIVRGFYHVQIMLDDQDRIAAVNQALQDLQEFIHVGKMQACGGLIQNVKSAACGRLTQFTGKLDPLRLTAGKGCGRLAQTDIP